MKRVKRLMRILGIQVVYPKKNLSKPHPDHRIYPYLLGGMTIGRPNESGSVLRTSQERSDESGTGIRVGLTNESGTV